MEYTPAAYRLFPRYRLDEVIQAEIDKITSAKLSASQWPDWAQITYQGVFHTDELRGTWGELHIHGA
jgi:hypothetical protein